MKKTRGSNENLSGVIRPSNVQGGGCGNRRALSTLNQNIVAAPSHDPYAALHKTRILTQKNKNLLVVPPHRPVTRRFAGNEPQQQSVLVEDAEVEMQDIGDDIDSPDKKNPLAVVEYIDDIYAYYKKTEPLSCVAPDYMSNLLDINERMRGILIDWLIEVHLHYKLMDETLYLTVNIIDRFLAVQSVAIKKLQLVGVTALLLACKYEQVCVPVVVDDLIQISDRVYCRQEVLDMERLIVNTLQFNLSLPTPYVFMRRFLKAAQSDKQLELLSYFLIELCLVEYEMLRFPPSLLAAAAIFTAQCSITGSNKWSKTCEKHTCYTQDQLIECAKLMAGFHEKAGSGKLTGVHNKYINTSEFGYVAKAKPAAFLIYDDR